jgi:AcrR family transcriptional regulator
MGRTSKKLRTPLNKDRVATTALAYIDKHGLDALNIRALGATLGVEGMALYKHFPSKDALLDAVAELLMLELVIPAPTSDGWTKRAIRAALDYRSISRRHPKAFPLLGMRRFNTPRTLALIDRILFALMADGLTAKQAAEAYRAVANWCNGNILDELAGLEFVARQGKARPVSNELTTLAACGPYMGASHYDRNFKQGLEALLRGLEERFVRER